MDNSKIKILIADDEKDVLEFVSYNLRKENFEVETAKNGQQAVEKAKAIKPHLILLDVMMPVMDGIQACQIMRQSKEFNQTMICFLTAMSEEFTHLIALDSGADDYIVKPIQPRLLITKIKSLVRRVVKKKNDSACISINDITISSDTFEVFQKGVPIEFVRKEFYLLHLLISKPGKVFTRREILEKVWGQDVVVNNRTIDVHIRKIREKLGDAYIKTVTGVGYKFDA